ncbi:MAG: rhodanese-like domain-containing protein [Crocinitomicaceae bacterium]
MKNLITLFILGLATVSISQKTLKNEEFNKFRVRSDAQVLDIRTFKEVQEGKIPNSINIDFFAKDFINQCESKFDKKKPLLVYCAAGGRSSKAIKNLSKAGFKKVYDLEGGFDDWRLINLE